MKFGKVLQSTAEYFPEKRFLCYKQLKKLLKANAPDPQESKTQTELRGSPSDGKHVSVARSEFIKLLNHELRALNTFFIGEEEEMVMRLQALESALNAAKPVEKLKYSGSLVEFHGDVIALLHWGILNYAAIAKILKKHDKTIPGQPIRQSYLEFVVQQPFYSMEHLERLAKRCEKLIDELSPPESRNKDRQAPGSDAVMEAVVDDSELCLKKMLHAIRTWRDLGDNAHTPSTVLPYSKPIPGNMIPCEQCQKAAAAQKKRHCIERKEIKAVSKIARVSD